MDGFIQAILHPLRNGTRSKCRCVIVSLFLGTMTFLQPIAARADDTVPRFEFLHMWVTKEEAHALRAFSDPVKAHGVNWTENQVSTNFLGVRDLFAFRLALGTPPSGLLWLGGDQPSPLFDLHMLRPIPNQVGERSFSDGLIPEVYNEVRSGDSILLLPVGIHLQNRMLYNHEVLARLNLPMPKTWQDLLNIAPTLGQNGVHVIALSDQRWQLRFLIASIMSEQFSYDEMREFLAGPDSADNFKAQLQRSIEIFLALRPYASPTSRDQNWTGVVEHIIVGDSFAAFLGDFVAPLLVHDPAVRCTAAPGNDYVIWSFDTIALVAGDDPAVIAGQQQLIETVIDPQHQQEYILRKGGVPAYHGLDTSLMDPCSLASMQSWERTNTKILLSASQWTHTLDMIASILQPAWRDPDTNPADTTADLIAAIDLMNGRHGPAMADN